MVDDSTHRRDGFGAQRCPTCARWYQSELSECPHDGSTLEEPSPLEGHVIVDRYRVVERIAKGGMGVVYLARHEILGREVALKVIAPVQRSGTAPTQRFLNEAKAISRIRHQNIVTLFDFGHLPDGRLFMALEYVRGHSLAEELKQGALSLRTALDYGIQLTDALAEAHRLGIVHRDIKPANIMLERGPRGPQIRLLDFGIADHQDAVRRDSVALGTPEYTAPEILIGGTTIDARADIYSLGVVLFELLTGSRPYSGSPEMLARRQIGAPIPSIDEWTSDELPDGLGADISRMMEKSPEKRPTSIDVVRDRLKKALEEVRVERVTPAWGVPALPTPPEEEVTPSEIAAPIHRAPRTTQNRWRGHGKAPVRWRYIVFLGLFSLAVLGVLFLQEEADRDQGVPTTWYRTEIRANEANHSVVVDPFHSVDRRLKEGARTALVPKMVERTDGRDNGLIPPPYAALQGRVPDVSLSLKELNAQIELHDARVQAESDPVERIRGQLSLVCLRWDYANRLAASEEHSVSAFGQVGAHLKDLLESTERIPARDTILYYLAYVQRVAGDPEQARIYEKELIDNYPQSAFATRAKVHVVHGALRKGRLNQARAIISDLRASPETVDRMHGEFLAPFLTYAQKDFADALDQSLAYIETAVNESGARSAFLDGMVELLVLSGAHSDGGALTVRGYLKGLGGRSYERRYLPLLGEGLLAAQRWEAASTLYATLLPVAPEPLSEVSWGLNYATALAGLDLRDEALNVLTSAVQSCRHSFLTAEDRAHCNLLYARLLIKSGEGLAASKLLRSLTIQTRLNLLLRTDLESAPHLQPDAPIQAAADALRKQLDRYQALGAEASLGWQAVVWGRRAQLSSLFASRLRTTPAYRRAAVKWQSMAREAAVRSGAAWSASRQGLDWYLSLGPLSWPRPDGRPTR